MSGFVPERRAPLVLFLVLALLLARMAHHVRQPEGDTLLESGLRAVTSPILSVTTAATHAVVSLWEGYVALRGARKEAREARRERDEARALALLAEESLRENRRLRGILELRGTFPDPEKIVPARVVGGAGDLLSDGILIDRGRRRGVVPGCPVVGGGGVAAGVVGRVVRASSRQARVQLLTDRSATVAVIEQETRIQGVVRGLARRRCEFTWIDRRELVRVGAHLVTSGMDHLYPPGLPVGTVLDVPYSDGSDLEVPVRPVIDPGSLEEVLVLPRVAMPAPPEAEERADGSHGEGAP